MANFASSTHALRAGFLIGTLVKAGITVELQYDEQNNYIDEFVVVMKPEEFDIPMRVRLKVLPPGSTDD
jgi:hypothetical protein